MVVQIIVECERLAAGIYRQRRGAGRVHANADDLLRHETARVFLRVGKGFFDGDFRALDVIGGMLAGEVRVAPQDDALPAVFVTPNGRCRLHGHWWCQRPRREPSLFRNPDRWCILPH